MEPADVAGMALNKGRIFDAQKLVKDPFGRVARQPSYPSHHYGRAVKTVPARSSPP